MQRYSLEERRKILNAFQSSNMTRRRFADAHDVNFHTLCYWLQREAPKPTSARDASARFVEVKTRDTVTGGIRMRVADSIEFIFPELPPPEYIAKLAAAVGATC